MSSKADSSIVPYSMKKSLMQQCFTPKKGELEMLKKMDERAKKMLQERMLRYIEYLSKKGNDK